MYKALTIVVSYIFRGGEINSDSVKISCELNLEQSQT